MRLSKPHVNYWYCLSGHTNDLKNDILLTESVISAFRHGCCSLWFKTGRNHSSAINFLPFQMFSLPPSTLVENYKNIL